MNTELCCACDICNNYQITINGLSNINNNLSIHYLIYRIDNVINGKYYIGQHQTLNVFDGYTGSGRYLIRAQQKYGLSAFIKTILFDFDNFDEMNSKEQELVQLSNCYPYDNMSYNLREGGSSGQLSEYSKKIASKHRKQTWKNKSSEEIQQLSQKMHNLMSGENNPMYGKDWRDGKSQEELDLHRQRIHEGHKKRTPEQKKISKDKERISKENRPQYLKDIHHQKCVQHAYDNWNNPIIKQKILFAKANKSQNEKDIENNKRSIGVHAFWDKHPEERQRLKNKYSGKGNGMYGRRKMYLISNPSIKILVKKDEIAKYLALGYDFSNPAHRISKSK